jgi:hypothetical protein
MRQRCCADQLSPPWNVVNGQYSEKACHAIGRICVNDPRFVVNYYSTAVIINAPYEICTATLPAPSAPSAPSVPSKPKPTDRRDDAPLAGQYERDRYGNTDTEIVYAIADGNQRVLKSYLRNRQVSPTYTYVYSLDPESRSYTRKTSGLWLSRIFRQPGGTMGGRRPGVFDPPALDQTVATFLSFGMDLSARHDPRTNGFDDITVPWMERVERRAERLRAFELLLQSGLRPVDPKRMRIWYFLQLPNACRGSTDSGRYAIQIFDTALKYFDQDLVRTALVWPEDDGRAGTSVADEIITRTKNPKLSKRNAPCLPLAARIESFLTTR